MKIVVDAMGGDHGVVSTVKGAIDAVNEYGVDVILVGKEGLILEQINKYNYKGQKIKIVNADEIITNEDKPVKAIRNKKNSSIVIGMQLVKDGEGDAFISAGNTGAVLTGGLFVVGRIKGIDRPAIAPVYPCEKGPSILLDAGANADCKAKYLQQFAIMGSVYANKILDIDNPKVGLVNIGTEKGKGNELVKEAYDLIENSDVNFSGNIEARDVPKGIVDVMVCDGFVGNTILKLSEGLAKTLFSQLKDVFLSSIKTKLAALMLKSGLKKLKNSFDYSEYGGALLIGLKSPVIKAHGSSNPKAIKNAIRQAKQIIDKKVVDIIKDEIEYLNNSKDNV
ncbi:phosphate acyltransferase PlsX [Abyssisolibacter fermentans]|uniref:phosphate acyltransferase PlsX n=1 Tax=Abyssisolibacter fermentans TaxID=1766203 RepID=UPI00082F3984|nr:phosphate acyltransferase PlsX [Abyssisolibacter fermentans]